MPRAGEHHGESHWLCSAAVERLGRGGLILDGIWLQTRHWLDKHLNLGVRAEALGYKGRQQ